MLWESSLLHRTQNKKITTVVNRNYIYVPRSSTKGFWIFKGRFCLLLIDFETMSATRKTPPSTPTMTAETLVALAITIRRLFSIYLFLPTLMAISPFVLNITYFLLNRVTKNHALLSLMLTVAMTSFCRDFIARSAPTKKDARESLEKCQTWLPMAIFSLSAIVIHGCISPLGAYLDATWLLTWSPRISFSGAFRIAISMCFLSLSLLCRYVGPRSVGRSLLMCKMILSC